MRWAPCYVGALVLSLGCAREPSSCDEAKCDATREYCVLYGSDTMAPSTASCHDLPSSCADAPSCDCLETEQEQEGLAFCFEAGSCEEAEGEAVQVVCPGG